MIRSNPASRSITQPTSSFSRILHSSFQKRFDISSSDNNKINNNKINNNNNEYILSSSTDDISKDDIKSKIKLNNNIHSHVHPGWSTNSSFQISDSGRLTSEPFIVSPGVQDFLPETGMPCHANVNLKLATRLIPMVRAFQFRGHLHADWNPLDDLPKHPPFISRAYARELERSPLSSLDYKYFGFTESDLDKPIELVLPEMSGYLGTWSLTPEESFPQWQSKYVAILPSNSDVDNQKWTVRSLYNRLKETYCGTIGVEYMHISDIDKCNFIRKMMETPFKYKYSTEMKKEILDRTAKARLFESFIGQKFATVKRFGLDGCETLVVGMKALTKLASLTGVESVVIGMPHRGRLNVLTNVLQKPFNQVMSEFQGITGFGGHDWGNLGDVKYHLGVEFEYVDPDNNKKMLMSVLPNPSHLEAVGPVAVGHARARQTLKKDETGQKVLPIILHGDSSVAGQGIVYETFSMSDVDAYHVGGTIHIVVNNQVGFTTDPSEQGSGIYCTDIGRSVNAPIFHVNADDPEAVTYVSEMALKYRQKYHSDVVIDLVGYRRLGHNELDMPRFTQPYLYKTIDKHPHVLDVYAKRLINEKVITENELETLTKNIMLEYEEQFKKSKSFKPNKTLRPFSPQWKDMASADVTCAPRVTGVPESTLRDLGTCLTTLPKDLVPHPTVARVYKQREQSIQTGEGIDFGFAEALAFGSLLREGVHIRLDGQDSQRGTFSHRHAVVHDQEKEGVKYCPLSSLVEQQKLNSGIEIHNSILSEYAVLGFDYGFALEHPNLLTIWEGQFGDFANGAQIIHDQFICAGEVKWNAQTGIVLMLPHGYDGQGPEHSSARIERWLQLCDDREDVIHPHFWLVGSRSVIQKHNIQVVNCTTPANLFHVLRRQIHRGFRKPLIIFSPKKLLRMKEALSPLAEFVEGTRFSRYYFDNSFQIPASAAKCDVGTESSKDSQARPKYPREEVRRLVLCSGQVYYDLLARRAAQKLESQIVIARVEQLSPFPLDQLVNDIEALPNLESLVWAQEEPMNMGPWNYVHPRIMGALRHMKWPNGIREVTYAGRDVAASPAVGDVKMHKAENDRLLDDAMDLQRKGNSYLEKYIK